MGAKGASGLPSITATLRLCPLRNPRPPQTPLDRLPTVFSTSGPTPGLPTESRPSTPSSPPAPPTHGDAQGARAEPQPGDWGVLPGCWVPASPPPAGPSPSSYSATPSGRSSGLGGCSAPTMFSGAYSLIRNWSMEGSEDRTPVPSRPASNRQGPLPPPYSAKLGSGCLAPSHAPSSPPDSGHLHPSHAPRVPHSKQHPRTLHRGPLPPPSPRAPPPACWPRPTGAARRAPANPHRH